ncbi:glutathione S-transferase family protein [Spongiibacter sp. KMU-158]|uniref:Glutathione S-transferase family protein n=1 Tax=Spongiibacter pelagi TaxID=2760804 RepID=A0A927C0S6_9GAMM|nr:glutathione S-transferase family protein [Spongiibacter pelagi]MBD2857932.1 glutathione S-transferase family protein [Spongiibacter pelagi]
MTTETAKPKLWHCWGSRSLRPLWALEEMGLDYELVNLPFPPRMFQREFLEDNPLGTVPYFTHGEISMTESSGICLYLAERFQQHELMLPIDHPEYGDFLNWLFQSDATLTFPLTLVLRYSQLEAPENRSPKVVEDYAKWFLARLKRLNAHLENREYLCDGRFTIADIAVGFALWLGESLGLAECYAPHVRDYLARIKERPAYKRVENVGIEASSFRPLPYPFGMDLPDLTAR